MGRCPLFAIVSSVYPCRHGELRSLACCRVTATEMWKKASQIRCCTLSPEHSERFGLYLKTGAKSHLKIRNPFVQQSTYLHQMLLKKASNKISCMPGSREQEP